jgi:hypothetical protein
LRLKQKLSCELHLRHDKDLIKYQISKALGNNEKFTEEVNIENTHNDFTISNKEKNNNKMEKYFNFD